VTRSTLKLVTQYDAQENRYSILRHNLTEFGAIEAAEDCRRRFSIFIIDQRGKHVADDVDDCEDCRKEIKAAHHEQPEPQFKRRHE